MAPQKLRELIRTIREAKTAADEREIVQKECAVIRAGFRQEDNEYRCRNVAKLLYIHMLGYPAHFGQLECLKLISSAKFADKRVGYLGAMMLLDELKDISLLITNCLKMDMNHTLQYVAGLALCTLGTICSAEMARDLADEIEKLLKSTNSYVRKKAVLCAVRIIRKVPDLLENFVPATRALLSEKNHGVLITGVTLITEMCLINHESLAHFRRLVPTLVRVLKNLLTSGYSPEHDVTGSTDPFLQVRILRLLRILGKNDVEASEAMNDILAQVATNTEGMKNVGNAILYEAVMCIMDIQAESGLRVLAVNILGKFLTNPDRNIRYVALNTLLKTVQVPENADAVQRHRSTIIDCLREPDVSIRRRALILIFALITQSNIRALVKELLDFLEVAESEFKTTITTEVLLAAEKHAPSLEWHVETALALLNKAGGHLRDDMTPSIAQLFASAPDMHAYVVQSLFKSLQVDISQQPLSQVALWCMGEFGHYLFAESAAGPLGATESQVLDLVQTVLDATTSSPVTRYYALMTTMKLSIHLPNQLDRIRTMIGFYANNVDAELQERSTEFTTVFNQFNAMRSSLLEPVPVAAVRKSAALAAAAEEKAAAAAASAAASASHSSAAAGGASGANELLDLLGGDSALPGDVTVTHLSASGSGTQTSAPAVPAAGAADVLDLLGGLDLGGSSSSSSSAPPPSSGGIDLMGLLGGSSAPVAPVTAPVSSGNALLDLMGGASLSAAPVNSAPVTVTAFSQGGLSIFFDLSKNPATPLVVDLLVRAVNATPLPMTEFVFLAAVPKNFQLALEPQSGSLLPGNSVGTITQRIKINNPTQQPLRLRIKITFVHNNQPITLQSDVGNLPIQ